MSTYVGPYMVVMNLVDNKSDFVMKCTTPGCPNRRSKVDSKFCPECGKEPKRCEVPRKEPITPYTVLDEGGVDNLDQPHAGGCEIYKDRSILIPRGGAPSKIKIDCSNYGSGSGAYPMPSDEVKNSDLEWFKKTYIKEITLLDEKFGKENITYDWGVVISWA